jgi:hypothetical protein
VTGHTKWSELRDEVYAGRPGMAEKVDAEHARGLRDLTGDETWEIGFEAGPVSEVPSEDTLRDQLVESVQDGAQVLDANVQLRQVDGKLLLFVVLVIAVGIGVVTASKRFSQAGKTADVVRLQLQEYGPIVAQTIRRAA